jgi:hypothetical protein
MGALDSHVGEKHVEGMGAVVDSAGQKDQRRSEPQAIARELAGTDEAAADDPGDSEIRSGDDCVRHRNELPGHECSPV